MTARHWSGAALCALPLAMISCIHGPGALVASTAPVGPGALALGPVWAESCEFRLLGLLGFSFDPYGPGNSAASAKKAALRVRSGATALVGVEVEESVGFALVGTVACVKVAATAVAEWPAAPGAEAPAGSVEARPTLACGWSTARTHVRVVRDGCALLGPGAPLHRGEVLGVSGRSGEPARVGAFDSAARSGEVECGCVEPL